MPTGVAGNGPVLLYDGRCGFCAASIQLVLRHDKREVLRFASLDSQYAAQLLERHPELRAVDSLLWVDPGPPGEERVLDRSDAALRVATYLGGAWRPAGAFRLVPRPLRDALYTVLARHRHRLARPECIVPSPEQLERFLH
jgi:predicted DCC family thiol-disulfide oxidoreductase YuxK